MVSRTKLTREGRVLIPAEFRRALELEPGDEVVLVLDDGEVRMTTHGTALARLRELATGLPSVDEFMELRRRQAQLEEEKHERWAGDAARRIGDADGAEAGAGE